jgi:hypothetical protein
VTAHVALRNDCAVKKVMVALPRSPLQAERISQTAPDHYVFLFISITFWTETRNFTLTPENQTDATAGAKKPNALRSPGAMIFLAFNCRSANRIRSIAHTSLPEGS